MTENVTTVTGVGATLPSNTTIGADNISSVYYERVKIAQGDTGTAVDVSSGAPLWVNIATTGNILGSFTSSTGTIGAVLQGTSPWVTSPSSQWTVSVTPTTQFSVVTTPSSTINVATTPSSIFQVSASAEVASMFNGTAAVTPTFASLACSSSGANQIVAPVSAKSIYLINAYLVAAGAVNLNFCSSGSSVSYGGVTALSSNAGYVLPFSPVGWLQSTTTGGLYLNLSAAVQVGGGVTYVSF